VSVESRVLEARSLLTRLGMDSERSNERSALVLLALLQLGPDNPWSEASNPMLGTRALMDWIRDVYGRDYAPNTRETIRRYTLHQFADATLVAENPDEPSRPVNSPRWNYQITPEALTVINTYRTPEFEGAVRVYLEQIPGLRQRYAAARELNRIPVILPGGEPFTLSPGGQNVLLKQMLEEFCPRFTPGGEVLYVGDADAKWTLFEAGRLAELGAIIDQHGPMPDVVVHMPDRNWLILMEAASSHGPVDGRRRVELADLFRDAAAGLVYVSCFPDRREMRRYLHAIAWETEVWCADDPTHLIHFNGERFLGPYA
jgi:type II restriction enzyme